MRGLFDREHMAAFPIYIELLAKNPEFYVLPNLYLTPVSIRIS